jgi:hypothetical protein
MVRDPAAQQEESPMNVTADAHAGPGYAVGEEVVVRLEGVDARIAGDDGAPSSVDAPWTIGEITAVVELDSQPRYIVRFRHGEETYLCSVTRDAIEGTA